MTEWYERDQPLTFRVWNGREFTDECSIIMGMEGVEVIGLDLPREKVKIQVGTGCVDKSGREIFEGDYLMTNEGDWIGAVAYWNDGFGCIDEYGGYSRCLQWDQGLVVGNVFEGIDEALVEMEEKRRREEELGEKIESWINRKNEK